MNLPTEFPRDDVVHELDGLWLPSILDEGPSLPAEGRVRLSKKLRRTCLSASLKSAIWQTVRRDSEQALSVKPTDGLTDPATQLQLPANATERKDPEPIAADGSAQDSVTTTMPPTVRARKAEASPRRAAPSAAKPSRKRKAADAKHASRNSPSAEHPSQPPAIEKAAKASLLVRGPQRPRAVLAKRVVQVSAALGPPHGQPIENFVAARSLVLDWLSEDQGVAVPAPAYLGSGFEVDITGSLTSCFVDSFGAWWTMRFDKSDLSSPGRVWRTEVSLHRTENRALIAAGLSVLDPRGTAEIKRESIPRFIRTLAQRQGLFDDGTVLSSSPLETSTGAGIERAIDLIERPARTRAVVVVSQDAAGATIVDLDRLGARIGGVAHLVVLENEASWEFRRRFTRRLSVFGGAVRLYRPSFDADGDSTWRHPLFLESHWRGRSNDLIGQLARLVAEETTIVRESTDLVPSFTEVRSLIGKQRLQAAALSATTQEEQLKLKDLEIRRLKKDYDDAIEWAAQEEATAARERERADEAEESLRAQRQRIRWLEERLQRLTEAEKQADEKAEELPASWDELESWSAKHLSGRVKLHQNAIRAARKSSYKDIPFAYAVLLYLACFYQAKRAQPGPEANARCVAEERRLHIETSPVGRAIDNHRTKEAYKVTYGSERIAADMHVSGSSDRDPATGFRLYFFYDDQEDLVVVTHFPSHLPNTQT